MTFASFKGRNMLANFPFQKYLFLGFWGDISFGLPRTLQTAFGLQDCIAYSKKEPDPTAPTENVINGLKRRFIFEILFTIFQSPKKANLGALEQRRFFPPK